MDAIKIELIDWIAKLKDQQAINDVLSIKSKFSKPKSKSSSKIFGSGKHLIYYVSDDFNEPLDVFKEYQK